MRLTAFFCCAVFCTALWGGDAASELAVRTVKDFNAGNFEAIRERSSEKTRKELTPELLTGARNSITGAFGAFQQIATVRETGPGAFSILAEYQKGRLEFKLAFDKAGKLVVFLASPVKPPPQPVSNEFFSETEIGIGRDTPLPGFLTVPKNRDQYPAVILVHGSGAVDRDETVGANAVFRDIAHGLAKQGIAVLRYDKRTFVYPVRVPTVQAEVIDDVLLAIEFLKGRGCKDIFVLGHSLGATLVPRIAAQTDAVAGYIMLAPLARPLEDAILEQVNYLVSLSQPAPPQAIAQLETVKREVRKIKELNEKSAPGEVIMGGPVSYWLDLKGYSPADSALKISKPVLLLQGERDYQVTMVDFGIFKDKLSSKPNFRLKSYPALNHLFISGAGPASPQEYGVKGEVAAEVIKDIGGFIKHFK